MEQYVGELIGRYRRTGVLVDTNLMLLYYVGSYDPNHLVKFDRTETFAPEDFDTLNVFLQQFESYVTTPHVLTEVSNLMGQLGGRVKTKCFALLASHISQMHEHHASAETLSTDSAFAKFGLTDTAISEAAPGSYLVLTDDLRLSAFLQSRRVDTLNFNHIRLWGYSGC
jgi:rRNA-processing protein FCF1